MEQTDLRPELAMSFTQAIWNAKDYIFCVYVGKGK